MKRNGIWGVDYRYETTIKDRVNEGDMLCFYALQNERGGLKRHIRDSRLTSEQSAELLSAKGTFVGIWRVCGGYLKDDGHIGWVNRDGTPEVYPHRRRISLHAEPKRRVPLNPATEIFRELIFVTDKTSSWYNILYSSMTLISQDDLEVFSRFSQ